MMTIQHVDIHDAHLRGMNPLANNEGLLLLLQGVSVYYGGEQVDLFDVWACDATITVITQSPGTVTGVIPDDGWIIDDELTMASDASCDWRSLWTEPREVLRMTLKFNNGTTLRFGPCTLRLSSLEKKEHREEWRGPL